MRRWLFVGAVALLVIVIIGAAALQSVALDSWVYRQMVHQALSAPDTKLAEADQLAVLLVGTGTPLPDVARAGPSTLIAAGEHLYLVDAGTDSARNLQLWRVPLNRIDGVLITHLHSDHIGGLADIRLQTWVAGRTTPLKVYGPPGIERVVAGFNEAYAIDDGYRTAHHGAAMLPPEAAPMVAVPIVIPEGAATAPVFDTLGLKATAIRVHHDPATPAYGYRFDYAGRSVTVSGDTTYDEDLARAAKNSDVLVHEGLAPELVAIMHDELVASGHPRQAKIFHDIPSYHSSPVDAARIANLANARLLLFTHMLPMLPNAIAVRAFLKGVEDVRDHGVRVGRDGLVVRLPKGSDAVNIGSVN
jgi:ribonuclease Z